MRGPQRRGVGAAVTAVVIVCLSLAAGGVAAETTRSTTTGDVAASIAPGPIGGDRPAQTGAGGTFDRTAFVVRVHENGSARWTFRYERTLDNDSEVETFRAFADGFEATDTDLSTDFRTRARSLVARARNETGRDMTATAFGRSAGVEMGVNRVGVVELSFRWSDFAATPGERVVVGDVFEGGFYLDTDQRFVVEAGEGLAFESVAPEDGIASAGSLAESDSVTWLGERSFTDNRPRPVFTTPNTSDPTIGSGGPGTGTTDGVDRDGGGSGGDILTILVGLAMLLIGIGAVVALRRSAPAVTTSNSEEAHDKADAESAATGTTDDPAATDEDEGDLVSDEDRVLNLLEENDGRMKQVNIVEKTGWSKSKVSMLLSDMDEEGQISKLRVGRENIISVAGEEPDAIEDS